MAINPTPPSPPKSNMPGKNIPVSEKKLEGLDKESPKSLDEKEVKKTGDSEEATSEEKEAKEEGEGEGKEKGEEEGEEEKDESEETEETRTSHFGLLNLLEPIGIMTFVTAVIFDLTGAFLFLLDFLFGIGEVFSWIFDDFIGGIAMYFLLKNVSSQGAESAKQIGQEAKGKIEKKAMQAGKKAAQQATEQAAKTASAVATKAAPFLGRFAGCFVGKVIPGIGALIPFWTILVLMTYYNS